LPGAAGLHLVFDTALHNPGRTGRLCVYKLS
jgi:hypothetical protein